MALLANKWIACVLGSAFFNGKQWKGRYGRLTFKVTVNVFSCSFFLMKSLSMVHTNVSKLVLSS